MELTTDSLRARLNPDASDNSERADQNRSTFCGCTRAQQVGFTIAGVLAIVIGFLVVPKILPKGRSISLAPSPTPSPTPTNETLSPRPVHRTCPDNETLQGLFSKHALQFDPMTNSKQLDSFVWTQVAIDQEVCDQTAQSCLMTVDEFENFCKGSYMYVGNYV